MRKIIIIIVLISACSMSLLAQDMSKIEKDSVLNLVIRNVEDIYPFPDISKKTIRGFSNLINEGYFDDINSYIDFATEVTSILENLSNDKHLDLIYNPYVASSLLNQSESEGNLYTQEQAKIEAWNNYGFKELKILDGNIGYLNLNVFFATKYAGEIADNSMKFFSNCNALIIDLRQNGGGWGDMVDYLLGYFVESNEPILINVVQSTYDGSYYSEVIPNHVPGKKLAHLPIYILSSGSTASAAESFIVNMKYFNKNAIVVGKKTRGAENPITQAAINEQFYLQIPSEKTIYTVNPIKWEGKGILPDVEVDVDDAFNEAYKLALETLLKKTNDKLSIEKYQWALDGLNASYSNLESIEYLEKYVGFYGQTEITIKENSLWYVDKNGSKLLIPVTKDYFLVDGIDYMRIKFSNANNDKFMTKIYSFGLQKEYKRQ